MTNTTVAVYARFSSDNQNPKSITDQYRKCEEQITVIYGATTEIIYYKDEAISGSNLNRPGYQQMISEGIEGKFKALFVDDLSRLSRDTLESHRILKEFRFYDIRIVAVADNIDTNNDGYKLQAGIKALINEEYIDALAKKTFRGMEGRAIEGKHCGGRTYGYDVVSLGEDQGSVLKINDEQAKWVRQIFEWYADGYSPRWIVSTLNEQGVPTSRTGKKIKNKWCANAVYGDVTRQIGMLNCQTYIGRLIWNKRKWLKTPDGRRVPKLNPESEWQITERPDLKIIDDILWKRVKNRQKETYKKSGNIRKALHENARIGRGPKYLMSGLMTCGGCGASYIVVNQSEYGCSTYKNRGSAACDNNLRVRRDLLENRIFASFKDFLFTPEHLTTFEQEVCRAINDALKDKNALTKGDAERLRSTEKQIENLINAIKMGVISPTVQDELKFLEQEKIKYEKRVSVEVMEIDQIHAVMPAMRQSFTDILNGEKPVPMDHIAKLRSRIEMILGEKVTITPKDKKDGLIAQINGRYSGLLKLSGLSNDKINLVAGVGFEPTTFRL